MGAEKKGWLKLREKLTFKTLWKRYWFVLAENTLVYFKKPDSQVVGSISLAGRRVSRIEKYKKSCVVLEAAEKTEFEFSKSTANETLYLTSDSDQEVDQWCEWLS